MRNIDKQRISAVRALMDMRYVFLEEWIPPMDWTTPATAESDAIHALLVARADALEGCTETSPEERELAMIAEATTGTPERLHLNNNGRATLWGQVEAAFDARTLARWGA